MLRVAIALIERADGAILIAQRRADAHLGNLWEFPGGKCLDQESERECVLRETREEVGLAVSVLEEWPSLEHVYSGRTVTLFPFLCHTEDASARPLESQQVKWVYPTELLSYTFPEVNKILIERLQKRAGS